VTPIAPGHGSALVGSDQALDDISSPGETGSGATLLGSLRRPGALFGIGVLVGWLLVAALAPIIAPSSPTAPSAATLLPPSAAHWLGTDELGRDVLSRVVFGARLSLPLALLLVILASVAGSSIGAFAGLAGGLVDATVMRVTDMFFAFPGIVLTMAFAAALGPSLQSAVLAVVIVSWPPYTRLVRGLVLTMRSSNYLAVSRLLGVSSARLLTRDVLPNVAGPILVVAMLDIGSAVLLLAGLSFLGLGAQPPAAEWGAMVSGATQYFSYWWMGLFPGLAIATVVFGVNMIGDALRDYFDPRSLRRPPR
jgi:ABC-type dipeptide/oligopeptide/nickel transport system permease subunit